MTPSSFPPPPPEAYMEILEDHFSDAHTYDHFNFNFGQPQQSNKTCQDTGRKTKDRKTKEHKTNHTTDRKEKQHKRQTTYETNSINIDIIPPMPSLMTIHENKLLDTHHCHTRMETNNTMPESTRNTIPEIERTPPKQKHTVEHTIPPIPMPRGSLI